MNIKQNIKIAIQGNPQQVFIGLGVFFTAIMGTSVHHVASTVFGVFFIASLFTITKWKSTWSDLTKYEKWLLIGFACYTASGVVSFINVQDVHEYTKILERYLRFLLAIPMYLYIRYYKINVLRYLYVGAIVSGPFLFMVALNSYMENPEVPAQGYYHHIIFSSVAMLNLGVMLVALVTKNLVPIARFLLIVSMACASVAIVLAQSRGVWLVFPVYFLVMIFYAIRFSKYKFLFATIVGILLVGSVMWILQGDMINKRINLAVNEVTSYYGNGKYKSSLGTRLAMWDIAIDVWKEYPIIGTGPGDFNEVIYDLQKKGEYVGMNAFTSTHNIYIQSVVNAGTIGLITMVFALFYAPYKALSSKKHNQSNYLLGLVLLSAFAIIGIGESWTLRLPMVSVYIAYVLTVVSSAFSEERQV